MYTQISNNKKNLLLFLANFIFIIHLSVIAINLFGWVIPGMFFVFLIIIVSTIFVDAFFGYCPFTWAEFNLRNQINPKKKYGPSFIGHYLYKFFKIGKAPYLGFQVFRKKSSPSFTLTLFALLALGVVFNFVISFN